MTTDSTIITDPTTLPLIPLPPGITSRFVDTTPVSLKFHILESLPPRPSSSTPPPLILLVHGFPNLAYDWRFILPKLAAAGFHAVAFDQRGYGRSHNADLSPIASDTIRPLSLIRDVVALVYALGHTSIHTLVGHDFGAVTSTFCALARPDMIRSLVLMSHPFKGVAPFPYATSAPSGLSPAPLPKDPRDDLKDSNVHESLLELNPPRNHYKWYYCTPPANDEMTNPTGQPLHEFLRGYFHLKSADNKSDNPVQPLSSWTAAELSRLPVYYIMESPLTMRENITKAMSQQPPSITQKTLSQTPWLPDDDLSVYISEWARTTFRGGLDWYKISTDPAAAAEMTIYAGAKIQVPMKFVSGKDDWGNYQEPGALEAMEQGRSVEAGCYRGTVMVEGAGHWVNQEKPEDCVREILEMAGNARS